MDDFFDIKQEIISTDHGDVSLPIFYFDSSSIMFSYFVDEADAKIILNGTGLKPTLFFGNKAMVLLVFFEYRDSSIGVYNEVGLATLGYPENNKKPICPILNFIKSGKNWNIGGYVNNLPVSTEIANAAGRKIWSLPKFRTEIPFNLTKSTFNGAVKDPDSGEDIFTIEGNIGKLGVGSLFNGIDLVLYSNHEEKLLKTVVDTKGKSWYGVNSNFKLKVGNSNHVMANNLKQLKLDTKKPVFTIVSRDTKSILPLGETV
ncbi:MAG: acetoacetate decarboxylase family protein [Flavobacteriales bacterium]|nr:acetoacetate decarboxylase family protein [Flavobacteriales bacterium]